VKDYLPIFYILIAVVTVGLGYGMIEDHRAHAKATPPSNVTDIKSCLAWLKLPGRIYQITDDKSVYYQINGPSSGYATGSSPSAYSFDANGKFTGWTPDADDGSVPGVHVSPTAKKEQISLTEVQKMFQ
jgi:hypothetical protein